MLSQIRPAIVSFVLLTIITGGIYPAVVTLVAHVAFPSEATGSMVQRGNATVGSVLIAQGFTEPKYFWPRPSAAGAGYDAAAASGSNLGPANPALADAVKGRLGAFAGQTGVPIDLVTTSASGLDPHISAAAARFQIARVAVSRKLSEGQVSELVERSIEPATFGCLGDSRVNVLVLNLGLDDLSAGIAAAEPATRPALPWKMQGFTGDPK